MCLAVPGQVIESDGDTARAASGGITSEAHVVPVPAPAPAPAASAVAGREIASIRLSRSCLIIVQVPRKFQSQPTLEFGQSATQRKCGVSPT